jgi:hypothetical protein
MEQSSIATSSFAAPDKFVTSKVNNLITVDFERATKAPARTLETKEIRFDYEELFPGVSVEATQPLVSLTPELINRRCYWRSYWPATQVFRIKKINVDNNTVYLNIVYRWVSADDISLLVALIPQRPPHDIELAHADLPF